MALAGLDIGSGGCKCTIYDHLGHVISYSFAEYSQTSPQPGCYELDLDEVWQKVLKVCGDAMKNHLEDPVLAMGISSFGESGVLVDKDGKILHPCIMYSDSRGEDQCRNFSREAGDDYIIEKTGLKPHPMYSVCKILWLKENKPDLFDRAESFLFVADYILFKFSGKKITDYSLASRTMLYDIWENRWDEKLLKAAGLKESFFSFPAPTGTPAGKVSSENAKRTGLSPETVLVISGQDQISSTIGSGTLHKGQAVDGMGSVDCITPVFEKAAISPKMSRFGYACIPFLQPGQYVTYAFTFSGGSLIRWFRDTFGTIEKSEAENKGCSAYGLLEKLIPEEPTNLLVLPHFQGAATPYMDPDSLGAILGMTIHTKKGDLFKALMEGVAYESKINACHLEQLGVKIDRLVASGGGSRSAAWLQIKADILNVPISVTEHEETGTLGAAILAGVACGVFRDVEDGVRKTVHIAKTYYPISKNSLKYENQFKKYQRIYQNTKNIYGD